MTATEGKCVCNGGKSEKGCPVCGDTALPGYWCEVCRKAVADKRCPLCGLKARKIREKGGVGKSP